MTSLDTSESAAPPARLMAILAHPDDESLGMGGTLARYAAEGIETFLVTATRSERGWFGEPSANPGLEALGRIREAELRHAVAALGIRRVDFLNYVDGALDQADPREAILRIVAHVRRERPQVVLTFGPDGAYGHPDHIAISQLATAALVAAADASYPDRLEGQPPHRVAKLYYKIWTAAEDALFEEVFGDSVMQIDGVERRAFGWPEWAITTRIDTADHWRACWEAVSCHRSQLPGYGELLNLGEARHRALWGAQGFLRAYSLVNVARALERDLFEGLDVIRPQAVGT